MLKRHAKYFSDLQKFFDFFLAILVWFGLFAVRFYIFPNAQSGLEALYLKVGLILGFLTLFFFSKEGLYRSYRLSSKYEELMRVIKANLITCITLIVLLYFFAEERLSRMVVLGYFFVSTCSYVFFKLTVRGILHGLRKKGFNLRYILLVGHGAAVERYVQNIKSFPESGIGFVGWYDSKGAAEKFGIPAVKALCEIRSPDLSIDSIVVGYQGTDALMVDAVLKDIYNDVVPIVVLPDMTFSFVGYQLDHFAGVPALIVNQPNFSSMDALLKRSFDVLSAGIGLLLISPLMLALMIGVKLSSAGPIFFGQERIGLDGRRFKMWKFRSMRINSQVSTDNIPGWTVKDDPRKTKFGSFMRATSLDELPQLWNVFVGDMSLVGPRPEQPYYVEKFRHEIPAYMLRHKVKAGITGWAQVNGWRGDTSLHERIECDLYYIRNWSMWFDVKILFLTFWKGFINKNAY